jgi:hypothetical protein
VSFLDQQSQQQQQKKETMPVTTTSGPAATAAAGAGAGAGAGLPAGVQVLDLTYPVSIPENTTTSYVQYFKLPSNK